jgi:hypothetical protein
MLRSIPRLRAGVLVAALAAIGADQAHGVLTVFSLS